MNHYLAKAIVRSAEEMALLFEEFNVIPTDGLAYNINSSMERNGAVRLFIIPGRHYREQGTNSVGYDHIKDDTVWERATCPEYEFVEEPL